MKNRNYHQNKGLLASTALIAVALVMPGSASAQGAGGSSGALEEIIVTSTKRDTSLMDVPISIGVVTGETIEDYAITDLTDLQGFVPSLTVQKTFGNWAIRIRGLGSGVTNLAFDSSVSVFNDGIYCGRSRCLETGFMDPQNVEVARGPQGALFGKSTIAGAISVASARPTDEFEAYLRAGVEIENGGNMLNGAISGPLTDSLRVRLAGQAKDLDGDMHNLATGNDDGSVESYAFRASMEWDVGPNTDLWAKFETASVDILGTKNQLAGAGALTPFNPNSVADPATLETNVDDVRYVSTGVSHEDFDYSEQKAFTARLDHHFGDHTLSIIGGIWDLESENYLDVDGVPEALLNTAINEEYEQQSLEARIVSPIGDVFDYIVGAMYHTSNTVTGQHSPFFPGFHDTVGAPGTLLTGPVGATGMIRAFDRDTDTFSVYGQITVHLTDRLSAIGDLRYTQEEQSATGSGHHITYPDLENWVLTPGAPFQSNAEYILHQDREDNSLDPSIRLLFEATDYMNVYAAYSTGSKSGGMKANDGGLGKILLSKDAAFWDKYAGFSPVTTADLLAGVTLKEGNGVFDFEDESAENFEVGVKMSLLDGAANFNASAFKMKFDDLQTSSYDGTQFIIGNAASADVSGVELEGQWLVSEYLKLSGSAAFISAEFDEFLNAQCPIGSDGALEDPLCIDGEGDLSGRQIERAPEVELNLGASYDRPVSDDVMFSAKVDMYYSGEFYVRQDFDPLGLQGSFTKWNARLALSDADDKWEVALVGRNLTDELTIQHAYEVLSPFVGVGDGRSLMLELTKRW